MTSSERGGHVRAVGVARAAAAALVAAAALAGAGCSPPGLGRADPDFLVIGHRGAPLEEAENTIASFDAALRASATAIETDLCLTRDDRIVLWHDRDPDDSIALLRQAGAEGLLYVPSVPAVGSSWRRPVETLTLDELRAHYGYAPLIGERDLDAAIPTLEELLAWAAAAPALRAIYLDVKFPPGATAAAAFLVGEVARLVASEPALGDRTIYFLSPYPDVAAALDDERMRLGVDFRVARDFEEEGALLATAGLGLRDVSTGLVPARTWSGFVDEIAALVAAREEGVLDSVTVWTFDDAMDWTVLLYHGVDGIMTNDPGGLHRLWLETL